MSTHVQGIIESHHSSILSNSSALLQIAEIAEDLLSVVSNSLTVKKPSHLEKVTREIEVHEKDRDAIVEVLTTAGEIEKYMKIALALEDSIQNRNFNETMKLQHDANALKRENPSCPIVHKMFTRCQKAMRILQAEFLNELRTPISLPTALEILSLLRRLERWPSDELALVFLSSCNVWISQRFSDITTDDSYTYILKLSEEYRNSLFEVVTQFRAAFAAEKTEYASATSLLLNSWLQRHISSYLATLKSRLPTVTSGQNLASLSKQSMYFAAALAKLGADFRTVLVEIFESTALELFTAPLKEASSALTASLKAFTWSSPPAALLATYRRADQADRRDLLMPPASLLEFPPLCILANSVVTACNNVRAFVPVARRHQMATAISHCMVAAANCLQVFNHDSGPLLASSQSAVFASACQSFADPLLPWVCATASECLGTSEFSPAPVLQALSGLYDPSKTSAAKQVLDRILQEAREDLDNEEEEEDDDEEVEVSVKIED